MCRICTYLCPADDLRACERAAASGGRDRNDVKRAVDAARTNNRNLRSELHKVGNLKREAAVKRGASRNENRKILPRDNDGQRRVRATAGVRKDRNDMYPKLRSPSIRRGTVPTGSTPGITTLPVTIHSPAKQTAAGTGGLPGHREENYRDGH